MSLTNASHKEQFCAAGWHSRGYLPHFDGRAIPQFITLHLADSIPKKVIQRWEQELLHLDDEQDRILLQKRIERYLDQGYGNAFLGDAGVAKIVQDSLLKFDGVRSFAQKVLNGLFRVSSCDFVDRLLHSDR